MGVVVGVVDVVVVVRARKEHSRGRAHEECPGVPRPNPKAERPSPSPVYKMGFTAISSELQEE